jgi:hypothetical protein
MLSKVISWQFDQHFTSSFCGAAFAEQLLWSSFCGNILLPNIKHYKAKLHAGGDFTIIFMHAFFI